ncbi:hypothetical protein ID866_10054 [Astraeus odoratus]|nr:hypothetical protein ID866_10054 [Astraeus odoratus]
MNNRVGSLRHSYFYVDTVTFQVEDCLFKVPRGPFEHESTIFCDIYPMPRSDNNTLEGLCDEMAIQLDGSVWGMIKMNFHRKHGSYPSLPDGIQEWTSVLKLSTAWDFKATRQAAIDALDVLQIGPIDRVVLFLQYDIKDKLLLALNQLAQRVEPISLEEAHQMGVDVALKLTWVREKLKVLPGPTSYSCRCYAPQNIGLFVSDSRDSAAQCCDFSEAIRTTFAL